MITLTKVLSIVTACLIIVGGLNWGLVGLFGFNLVDRIFGNLSVLSRITYVLVGLSALYQVVMFRAVSSCWIEPARTSPSTAH
jgi:uncharacterized membrane protein YuzA (DUF378 family)